MITVYASNYEDENALLDVFGKLGYVLSTREYEVLVPGTRKDDRVEVLIDDSTQTQVVQGALRDCGFETPDPLLRLKLTLFQRPLPALEISKEIDIT